MKKTLLAIGLAAATTFGAASSANACLTYVGKSNDSMPVIGRTVEFGYDVQTLASFPTDFATFPRGSEFTTYGSDKPLTWNSKYGFSGMSHGGLVSDGINEKGLYVAMLWFADGKYPAQDTSEPGLASGSIVNWLLGNFASVDEAVSGLAKINVYQSDDNHLGIELPAHFQLVDKSGKVLVVEYIDGEMTVTDNTDLGVMTNSPKIADHKQAYQQFLKQKPHLDAASEIDGGMLEGLPGGYTALERTVRTAILRDLTPKPKTKEEAINQVIHTLNTTDYVRGAAEFPSRGMSGGKQETSFITVIDMANMDYYYRTVDSLTLHKVDLNQIDYSAGQPVTGFNIYGGIRFVDVTDRAQ